MKIRVRRWNTNLRKECEKLTFLSVRNLVCILGIECMSYPYRQTILVEGYLKCLGKFFNGWTQVFRIFVAMGQWTGLNMYWKYVFSVLCTCSIYGFNAIKNMQTRIYVYCPMNVQLTHTQLFLKECSFNCKDIIFSMLTVSLHLGLYFLITQKSSYIFLFGTMCWE